MMETLKRLLVWALVILVLLGVFLLYIQPSMLIGLADMVWSCFG